MSVVTNNSDALCDWVPQIDIKIDPKQLTFKIPLHLFPIARQILYKRYIGDINNRPEFSVQWTDYAKPNRPLVLSDSTDFSSIPTSLPSDELYRTKVQVNCTTLKLITITVFYTTGTVLVQGNLCKKWLRYEFESLIQVIRTIFSLTRQNSHPNLNKAVCDNLSDLPLPSLKTLPSGALSAQDIPSPHGPPHLPRLHLLTSPTTIPPASSDTTPSQSTSSPCTKPAPTVPPQSSEGNMHTQFTPALTTNTPHTPTKQKRSSAQSKLEHANTQTKQNQPPAHSDVKTPHPPSPTSNTKAARGLRPQKSRKPPRYSYAYKCNPAVHNLKQKVNTLVKTIVKGLVAK